MPGAGDLWTISAHTLPAYGLEGAVRTAREASGCLSGGSSGPGCRKIAGLRSMPEHLEQRSAVKNMKNGLGGKNPLQREVLCVTSRAAPATVGEMSCSEPF